MLVVEPDRQSGRACQPDCQSGRSCHEGDRAARRAAQGLRAGVPGLRHFSQQPRAAPVGRCSVALLDGFGCCPAAGLQTGRRRARRRCTSARTRRNRSGTGRRPAPRSPRRPGGRTPLAIPRRPPRARCASMPPRRRAWPASRPGRGGDVLAAGRWSVSRRYSIRALGAASVAFTRAMTSRTAASTSRTAASLARGVPSSSRAATLYGSPVAALRARMALLRARSQVTGLSHRQRPHAPRRDGPDALPGEIARVKDPCPRRRSSVGGIRLRAGGRGRR